MTRSTNRRRLLCALGLGGLAGPAAAALPTPEQTPGPFHPPPDDRVADEDSDLVRIEGHVRAAGGEVLHLSGVVRERSGAPLAGARIEIWQCDANGRYRHQRDMAEGERDPAFQGYGVAVSDPQGRYAFRTIRPVPYPGRTPHIHARVHRPDGGRLTTQLYIDGHRLNARDWIFRSLGRRGQKAATMALSRRTDGDWQTSFDFVV